MEQDTFVTRAARVGSRVSNVIAWLAFFYAIAATITALVILPPPWTWTWTSEQQADFLPLILSGSGVYFATLLFNYIFFGAFRILPWNHKEFFST